MIPLNNVSLVQKIHQTYRMQYVIDVVLPTPPQSAIDDNALSTLSSFIFFNKMEIVTMIQVLPAFCYHVFMAPSWGAFWNSVIRSCLGYRHAGCLQLGHTGHW